MAHWGLLCQIKKKSVYDYPQRSVVQPFTYTTLAVTTSQLRTVVKLTLRSLTLYIYGAPILDVSRSHTTTQHSR